MAKTSDPEPVVLADRELIDYTDGYMLWDSMFKEETAGRGATKRGTGKLYPNFSPAETAKFFFGKDVGWLRWRMKEQHFFLNGEEVGTKRDLKTGHRYFTLADIERMGHSLAQIGALSGAELQTIMVILRNVARIYGIMR